MQLAVHVLLVLHALRSQTPAAAQAELDRAMAFLDDDTPVDQRFEVLGLAALGAALRGDVAEARRFAAKGTRLVSGSVEFDRIDRVVVSTLEAPQGEWCERLRGASTEVALTGRPWPDRVELSVLVQLVGSRCLAPAAAHPLPPTLAEDARRLEELLEHYAPNHLR